MYDEVIRRINANDIVKLNLYKDDTHIGDNIANLIL